MHGSGARREGRATNETLASPYFVGPTLLSMLRLLGASYRLADELAQSASVMVGLLLARSRPSSSRRDPPTGGLIETER